jgi:hypothetical protein
MNTGSESAVTAAITMTLIAFPVTRSCLVRPSARSNAIPTPAWNAPP